MLKSAWQIALDKHEKHQELSVITLELLEHVQLLEEGWNAIGAAPTAVAMPNPARDLPRAA